MVKGYMWNTTTFKKTFKVTKLYREMNEKYFGNLLEDYTLEVVPDPSSQTPAVAAITPYKKRTGTYAAKIRFNSRIDWNEKNVRETLLHELIHYYIYVKTGWGALFPHGPRFVITMLRINLLHREHVQVYWHEGKVTLSDGRPK